MYSTLHNRTVSTAAKTSVLALLIAEVYIKEVILITGYLK